MSDISTSNSLADLAARIRAEHEACASNDSEDVGTKCRCASKFGNDSPNVGTKCPGDGTFGNDAIGFIRVRKRKLKGGHPQWRDYCARASTLASTSRSFDLVKAVRVGGKHKSVLGLGSQKGGATGRMAAYMLLIAIGRMKRHGLNQLQRQALLAELIRKGARRPTVAKCEGWNLNTSWTPFIEELVTWLRAQP